jgi:hypothetical protein
MMQLFVLNLITIDTNITFTESHEAALFTELNYQRHQHNLHRIKRCIVVY